MIKMQSAYLIGILLFTKAERRLYSITKCYYKMLLLMLLSPTKCKDCLKIKNKKANHAGEGRGREGQEAFFSPFQHLKI